MYVTAKGIQLLLSKSINNWMPSHTAPKVWNGTAGNDIFYAVSGDTMIGGAGDDQYSVWDAKYTIVENANEGVDTVNSYVYGVTKLAANVENLFLLGAGSTTGVGNALSNIIVAGSVGAFLDGGAGDDVLVGGAGKDVFQVTAGQGSEAIEHFTAGTDIVRLQNFKGVSTFSDLMSHSTQVGTDVKITLSSTESLVLRDVTLGSLHATDFLLPIDTSKMTLSFTDEFSQLTLKNAGGMWTPSFNFGAGSPENHGFVSEAEVYVDPSYAGSGKTALGINPFSVSADGVLSITSAPTAAANLAALGGKAFTSGMITTQGSFSQQYGYFEIRAALPEGQGMWPAFWLLPTNLAGGEIDIMESLGGDAGNIYLSSHDIANGVKLVDTDNFRVFDPTAMHTYAIDWTKETLTYYIDGTAVATQPTPDLLNKNGEFFMTLNLANGGWAGTPAADATGTFSIDYVHVYANSETVSRTVNGVQEFAKNGVFATVDAGIASGTITGTAGNDTLLGTDADNIIHGLAGNDVLDGAGGANTLIGGAGDDTYIVRTLKDVVVEAANEGTDLVKSAISYTLTANVENLTLTGTAGTSATGNELANVLTGNAGANTLNGGAGADTMIGGAGNDTYIVDNANDVVIEAVGGGRDTVITSVSYKLAAGQEIENLRLAASAGKVALTTEAQNGSKAWSNATTAGVTRFEVRSGDHWAGDGTDMTRERSEVFTAQKLDADQTYQISFSVMIEPGKANTADWMTLFQLQQTPDANEAGHSPAFALEMVGDKMRIVTRDSSAEISTADNINTTVQYTDASNIVRGQWYNFTIDVKLDPSGAGTLTVVRDGTTLVSYTGAIGFNDAIGGYLKEGVYREASAETFAADFKGLTLSTVGDATAGNQSLTGNEFANTLTGNAGNNTLDGGAGADTLIGGAGDDTYIVDNVGDVVKEAIDGGNDTVITSVSYALTKGQYIENLRTNDSKAIVALNLSGNEFNNTITGNAGNNIIDGGAGDDIMIGGLGDDSYIVGSAKDVVIEAIGGGIDTVISTVSYTLAAGQEIEKLQLASGTGTTALNLTGNEFANTLLGNAGDNILDGGGGADVMTGGLGNDTYIVDDAGDVVKEAANGGIDTVLAKVSYTLGAGQSIENLSTIDANATTAINLTGNDLANLITGNAGNNVIRGGGGQDVMIGGGGADTFVFADNDTGKTADTADVIKDFSHAQGDKIDLSKIDANTLVAGDQGFTMHANGNDHVAGALWMVQTGNVTFVNLDTNGDGKADYMIQVVSQSTTPLVASDFVF